VEDVIIADSGELPLELEVDAEGKQIPVRLEYTYVRLLRQSADSHNER
jgi:hypothetical protein